MKKPELTDEDKEVLARMRANRDAAGKVPARAPDPGSTLGDRMATPDEDGTYQEVPVGVPTGVVVVDGAGGVSLYRDGRAHFSAAVPGRPRFESPTDDLDARLVLRDVPVELGFRWSVGEDVPPTGELVLREVRIPGVDKVTTTVSRTGTAVLETTVLARGEHSMTIRKRYDTEGVDAPTWVAIDTALLGAIVWGEDRTAIPSLLPPSPWLDPGLPVALKASPDRPEPDGDAAVKLRELAGHAPPSQPISDEQRAAAGRALGGQAAFADRAKTIHDLRALALTLSRALDGTGPAVETV